MLSKNALVGARKAVESLYYDTCTVMTREKYKKENGATGFREAVLLREQPCRITFSSLSAAVPGEAAATVVQGIKLYIAPEIEIPAGCKLVITRKGRAADRTTVTEYARSGVPAIYETHQEVSLELFERWA